MRNPVRDAERAVFGEVPVIESEEKVAFSGTEALQGVSVTAREVPGIARSEFRNLGLPIGRNHGTAATAFEHVGPLGSQRVPMKLTDCAGLQPHRDACDTLRNGKLGDS